MKRIFDKLSGREQGLFLLLIWSAILYWGISSLGQVIEKYQAYDIHAEAIGSHNEILSKRKEIEKRIRQRLDSHDNRITNKILENSAYGEAKSIHQSVFMEQSRLRDLGEFFKQHTVRITFKDAEWAHLKGYVNKIRDRKHMFLSDVMIDPEYKDDGHVDYYKADFSVSALELKKRF